VLLRDSQYRSNIWRNIYANYIFFTLV